MKKLIAVLAVVAVFGLGAAQAVPIAVVNPSFETDTSLPPSGWWLVAPDGGGNEVGNPTSAGVSASPFGGRMFRVASNGGPQAGLVQTLGTTYAANTVYTLSLWAATAPYTNAVYNPGVGEFADDLTVMFALRDGTGFPAHLANTVYAQFSATGPSTDIAGNPANPFALVFPDDNVWREYTASFDTALVPAAVGMPIQITLHRSGKANPGGGASLIQGWDNITVAAGAPIPEPAGLGLMGVALLALRRKRS